MTRDQQLEFDWLFNSGAFKITQEDAPAAPRLILLKGFFFIVRAFLFSRDEILMV
jgi:hypothetical protein